MSPRTRSGSTWTRRSTASWARFTHAVGGMRREAGEAASAPCRIAHQHSTADEEANQAGPCCARYLAGEPNQTGTDEAEEEEHRPGTVNEGSSQGTFRGRVRD